MSVCFWALGLGSFLLLFGLYTSSLGPVPNMWYSIRKPREASRGISAITRKIPMDEVLG
ncbi:hypothetical protein Patl1_05579 [Pistacia atlantica]|uniref:Uncharacterized protein n=1 Tax=Pistacia atlantica TaxID=434234 RepID=A0ACC1BQ55_9ROSI|nr:hypothetical protein Patl1_05579 [Pistacia atlantica]